MRILQTFVALALPVLACECSYLTVCELIQQPTIFIGEVIDGGVTSIRDDPWFSNVDHVRFKVVESFRGLPRGTRTVDVALMPTAGMCAPIPYYPGRRYLVVPYKRDGKLYEGACFQGRDVEFAADDVRQVREYFAGTMPINVHGQVAVARDDSSVNFLLEQGEAKRLAGVTISASRGNKMYSATTDRDGRYTVPLPEGGAYQIRAALKPYRSKPSEITVALRGCATHDFGLTVDNTIAGKVIDGKGQPIKNAKVGLIDLDRVPSEIESHVWFNHAYTEQPDMSFLLKNVPIGRYLLVFNPDGPRSGGYLDFPYESTTYPSASTRSTAKTIEIKSDGVHLTGMDLVLGKPILFRKVFVHARFPDGAPMKTARIQCIGLPSQEGDIPWIGSGAALESGWAVFSAPANRKLRLEVTDRYGRDLKKTYATTYEPGDAEITHDFVIRP